MRARLPSCRLCWLLVTEYCLTHAATARVKLVRWGRAENGAGGDLSALSESGVMPGGAGEASDFSYIKARGRRTGVKRK
jgi:hypothetical protein